MEKCQHKNIKRVYSGGSDLAGLPYCEDCGSMVFESLRGQSIRFILNSLLKANLIKNWEITNCGKYLIEVNPEE